MKALKNHLYNVLLNLPCIQKTNLRNVFLFPVSIPILVVMRDDFQNHFFQNERITLNLDGDSIDQ